MSLRLNFPIPRAVTRRAPAGYRRPVTREEEEVDRALRKKRLYAAADKVRKERGDA